MAAHSGGLGRRIRPIDPLRPGRHTKRRQAAAAKAAPPVPPPPATRATQRPRSPGATASPRTRFEAASFQLSPTDTTRGTRAVPPISPTRTPRGNYPAQKSTAPLRQRTATAGTRAQLAARQPIGQPGQGVNPASSGKAHTLRGHTLAKHPPAKAGPRQRFDQGSGKPHPKSGELAKVEYKAVGRHQRPATKLPGAGGGKHGQAAFADEAPGKSGAKFPVGTGKGFAGRYFS